MIFKILFKVNNEQMWDSKDFGRVFAIFSQLLITT